MKMPATPTRHCLECGRLIRSRFGLCKDCSEDLERREDPNEFEPEDDPDPRRDMPRSSNL